MSRRVTVTRYRCVKCGFEYMCCVFRKVKACLTCITVHACASLWQYYSRTCCCCWLLVGCLTSQQQASVSQGRICPDNFTCCHTETEVADQTFYLTQLQHTDTGPTIPSADPITPGAWQGSHWSANFEVTGMTRPRKKSRRKRDSNPGSSTLEADALTTRPTRRSRGLGDMG